MTQPKTANSVRTIYLPPETIELLVQEHDKHPGDPVMFPAPVTGKLYGPDCIGRLHKTLLKKAGITENIPFRGLRHAFATPAIRQGADAKTVSSILGLSTPFQNVDFRRNGMSFFTGQHTGVIQPYTPHHLPV